MKSLLVCLVGLLVSVQANPVSPPMVSGQVRLADGSPVAGARVVLFDLADLHRGPVSYTLTDAAGQFALRGTAQGPRPHGVGLGQNYPNPFNPATVIPYQLAAPARVRLEVFNVLGQPVATLVEGEQAAGEHVARWDGTDAAGRPAASGLYFYRLTVGGMQQTRRMVLVDGQVGVPSGGAGVEAGPLSAALSSGYGLVVSGEGLATYVDAAFGVPSGPVAIEVAARPAGRAKAVATLEEVLGAGDPTAAGLLSGVLGDVDNSGAVDLADGLLVAMHRVQPGLSIPNQGVIGLGDVDCSGQIEERDAELLATWVVNPAAAAVASLSIGQRGGYSLDPVTEMMWGSILQNENQDATVAQLLDEVPVLLSGIMEVYGKEHLYLGIDRAYHEQHGSKHIYTALKKRFPVTPLFVEPSDGVQRQSAQRSRGEAPPVPVSGEPIAFTESPNAVIEDDTKHQTVGTITVPDDITVGIVSVGVDLTHSSRSDLTLDLVAPSGVATRIYNGFGEGVDTAANLVEVLPATSALRGQAAQGTWYLRASDHDADDAGVLNAWELTITPMSAEAEQAQPEGVLFADTFEDGLGAWTADATLSENAGWAARPFEGDESEDIVAQTWDCPLLCNLTTTQPLDLSAYRSVTLAFDRWIDRDIGDGEGLRVLIGNHGVYQPLEWWQAGDSAWRRETFILTASQLSDAVTLRFVGIPTREFNQAPKQLAIDNIVLTEDAPNLTVSTITASPAETVSGASLSLNTTVQNTGSALAPSATVRFYRHTAETATPTSGGTLLSETADTGTLALGAGVSIAVAATAPTVAEPTQYHYYACIDNDCAGPATVTVRPQEPTETPVVTIQTITATPTTVESGGQLSLSATAQNTTNTTAPSETIRFYRHAAPTATPTKGGTRLSQTTTTGTLAPGASVTRTVTRTVRTVTEPTTYHYYACTDDDCAGPATVTIQLTQPEPTPTEPETDNAFTLSKVNASRNTVDSESTFSLTTTVTNTGNTATNPATVNFYRHTNQTTTPTTGGAKLVQTAAIPALQQSEATTAAITTVAPATTETIIYRYYACIEDTCATTPATIQVQAQQAQPDTNLSIQTITAIPTTVPSGGNLSLTITVRNNGTTVQPTTIRFYRHTNQTTTPTTGGAKIVQTTTTGTLAPNATTTKTITTIAPTVTETTTYHYYACIGNTCTATPATIQVQATNGTPVIPIGTDTITRISASPYEPESETPIIVRFTVKNNGTSAAAKTVTIYRHTELTTNPTNGSVVEEVTTATINAKASITDNIMTKVPHVTTATKFHYYACTDNTCAGPATVTAHQRAAPQGPSDAFYCHYNTLHRRTPMGGNSMLVQDTKDVSVDKCGTITLGGLETTDGTRGFVVSGHAVDPRETSTPFTSTDALVGYTWSGGFINHFLGKVLKASTSRVEGGKRIITADAAFVAYPYPSAQDCTLTWSNRDGETFCIEVARDDHVIERVTPLTIQGNGKEIYTVTGSQRPTNGLKINTSGSVSGVGREGNVTHSRVLVHSKKRNTYSYDYVTTKSDTIYGDSGAPVFTTPDKDGNTRIVGIHVGDYSSSSRGIDDKQVFNSWEQVTEALDLKPIEELL